MKSFKLSIRTPAQDVYDGPSKSLSFFAEDGALQIMAHHASFMTSILFSRVRVEAEDGSEDQFLVRGGLFQFDRESNSARMLVLNSEKASEMDLKSAKEYLEFLNQQLAAHQDLSEFQIVYLKGEKVAVEHQLKKTAS